MKVINLWAGPGAGKSTTAAGLFHRMKSAGKRVELVTEFAKDLTWEHGWRIDNQLLIFAEQDQRLRRLKGQVDYAITDSPLPLSLIYAKPPFDTPEFGNLVMHTWRGYDNVNFLIGRVKPYMAYGRSQDEAGARMIDQAVWNLLSRHAIPFHRFNGDGSAVQKIESYMGQGDAA